MGRGVGAACRFSLWGFVGGEGVVGWSCNPYDMWRYNSGDFHYKPGEGWLIPAVLGSHGYYPKKKTRVLIASPRNPKLDAEKNSDGDCKTQRAHRDSCLRPGHPLLAAEPQP